jgi:DNA-binding XRE family transcriptional regulator
MGIDERIQQGLRLQQARKRAGLEDAGDAADALGVPRPTYYAHENGSRGFKANAEKYARKFKVRLEWLWTGQGSPTGRPVTAPIVGHVGAGAEMYFEAGQGPFGEVALPEGQPVGTVAVEIRGDSLGPFNGWFAYFTDRHDPPTDTLIGVLCVVGLADGRVLIKKLGKGRRRARFDLWGAVGEPLQDQPVSWAAAVTALLPPHMARAV